MLAIVFDLVVKLDSFEIRCYMSFGSLLLQYIPQRGGMAAICTTWPDVIGAYPTIDANYSLERLLLSNLHVAQHGHVICSQLQECKSCDQTDNWIGASVLFALTHSLRKDT